VALLGRTCILDDLAAGRLVRAFDLGFPTGFGYYVVSPPAVHDRPHVAAIRGWLLDAAARSVSEAEKARV
jgi:LysR family glycine cleavage system transcriptional activator